MERRRWIKLYMMDYDEVYHDSKMFHLWIDILLHTNPVDYYHHGDLIKRGQCILSLNQVASRCHMSKPTVSKYLRLLEECGKIKLDISKKGTKVTVLNWDKYQSNGFSKSENEEPEDTTGLASGLASGLELNQELNQELNPNKTIKEQRKEKREKDCTVEYCPSYESIFSIFFKKDKLEYISEYYESVKDRTDIRNLEKHIDGFLRNKEAEKNKPIPIAERRKKEKEESSENKMPDAIVLTPEQEEARKRLQELLDSKKYEHDEDLD